MAGLPGRLISGSNIVGLVAQEVGSRALSGGCVWYIYKV